MYVCYVYITRNDYTQSTDGHTGTWPSKWSAAALRLAPRGVNFLAILGAYVEREAQTYNGDMRLCSQRGPGKAPGHRASLKAFLPERDYVTFGSLLSQFRLSDVCRLSVVCLSVTLVHPSQGVEPFGKISSLLCTLAILWPPCKILRR